MRRPSAAVAKAVARDAAPSQDKLDKVRVKVKEARDLDVEISDLHQRLSDKRKRVQELTFRELPDLFQDARITRLDLEPEGNLPGYGVELHPYYKANIAADWEPEKQQRAFDHLEEKGAGDLIKTVITVELGRGTRGTADKIEKFLDKLGVPFESHLGVPWNSLTAWLKAEIRRDKRIPPAKELEAIGATVGTVVTLKPKKEK
jgi:hypothetical protein